MRALLVATLVAAPAIASAGTYIGAAVGPGADLGDGYAQNGRHYRGILGYSIGQISIEGLVSYNGALDTNNLDNDVINASVAGKYSLPLSDGFEVFGRLGYGRTWVNPSGDTPSANGDGFLLGAGVEYRLKLVATQASIFLDYNYTTASLNGTTDFSTRGFTIGATVGF